jgi:hypothetical protein
MKAYTIYYESATRGRSEISEASSIKLAEKLAFRAFSNLKSLKNNNMIRSVVCVRCYRNKDDNLIFQYGSI